MDPTLKNWILRKFEQAKPRDRQDFLRMLKFEPKKALAFLSDSLPGWGLVCVRETQEPITHNHRKDPPELLRTLKEWFATEIYLIKQ